MRQPLKLTGAQLRKAFAANLEAPGDLPTIEEAIGLPREDCAVVLKALESCGKLDQVTRSVYTGRPRGRRHLLRGLRLPVDWLEGEAKGKRKGKPSSSSGW
jgi:hypothetical protein